MLYRFATWTIAREEIIQMWCYKRIEKISWTSKITNGEVVKWASERKSIWKNL